MRASIPSQPWQTWRDEVLERILAIGQASGWLRFFRREPGDGDDVLVGSRHRDEIDGSGGNDLILGLG